jgi:hypothetical protein
MAEVRATGICRPSSASQKVPRSASGIYFIDSNVMPMHSLHCHWGGVDILWVILIGALISVIVLVLMLLYPR